MTATFTCVTCGKELFRLPEDEYMTEDGAIFCPTTNEIHYRTLDKEQTNANENAIN